MQFHFYTVMAFDAHQNGVPVAWVISSSAMEIEVRKWLGAMRDRMLQLNPAWRPTCTWHVLRNWMTQMSSKVKARSYPDSIFKYINYLLYKAGLSMKLQKLTQVSVGLVDECHSS